MGDRKCEQFLHHYFLTFCKTLKNMLHDYYSSNQTVPVQSDHILAPVKSLSVSISLFHPSEQPYEGYL